MKRRDVIFLAGASAVMAACGTDPKTDGPRADSRGSGARPSPNASWREFTDPSRNGYSDRVFFDFDQYEIRPDQRATVEAWAAWSKAHPGASFMIEGHADERGTREYNLGLGARRAASVRNYLGTLGVEPGRVRTISYGKERPAEVGGTEEAYAKNRRGVAVPSGPGA
jgi:peptidoglycan-associated lipoprotein